MSKSKFAGIFAQTAAPPVAEAPPGRTEKSVAAPRVVRPVGRPPGKRSDPAWKQYSVLLRQDTQRAATRLLREGQGGGDLSALVETLLAEWVEAQRR